MDIDSFRSNAAGRLAVRVYRLGHWTHSRVHTPVLRGLLWWTYRVLDMLIVRILNQAEIPATCEIGHDLRLPNGGNGIFIHHDAVIGDDVVIFHQVTLGMRNRHEEAPRVGHRVFLGAGAKVLGNVCIGHDAVVGANAVVLHDVPPATTAVGVPAVALHKGGRPTDKPDGTQLVS